MNEVAKISFFNDETDFRVADKGRVRRWIAAAADNEGRELGAVNYIFCGPERHLEINRSFLGHDWPTDVITFDYSTGGNAHGGLGRAKKTISGGGSGGRNYSNGGKISGDIFIDPATVEANAAALCVAREVEMRRVMIHGVLHLCGYEDKTTKQLRQMRAKEDAYLRQYYEKKI